MPAWLGMSTPSPCWPFQKAQDKQREWAALTHLTTMGEKLERRSKQPNFFSFLRHWGGVLIFMGLVPQPALSLCLASFQWGFALLFRPPNQKMWCDSVNVVFFRLFSSLFGCVWGGMNLPLVTPLAPLWSPWRRLTLSLRKPGQGQATAWLGTPLYLWSPGYGEIISKF